MAPRRRTRHGSGGSASPPPSPAALPAASGGSSPLSSLAPSLPSSSTLPSPRQVAASTSTSSPFLAFREQFKAAIRATKHTLERRRADGATEPVEEAEMEQMVEAIMDAAGRVDPDQDEPWRLEARKEIINRALSEQLLDIDEDKPLMCDFLDVILTFQEKGYAELTLPLTVLYEVVELETVAGCHHVFNYVDSRRERLTKDIEVVYQGMTPALNKGPLLLRLLNELLRRLPKSQPQDVILSGRILMFLSSVFPLAEKSGVNLRGNFNVNKGTVWEGPEVRGENAEVDVESAEPEEDVKMEVASTAPPAPDFYETFWSLQTFFTNPPLLFNPAPSPAPDHFITLRDSLQTTLNTFAKATQREKELGGSGATKIDVPAAEALEQYFFPKFLTSRNLLELEIADPAFRRQILVQMLVLFQFLLSLTLEERSKALALPVSNPAALQTHILTPANETWVLELRAKALSELSSMPGGDDFRQTIELILKREQNWINWKLTSCLPFSKDPVPATASATAEKKITALTNRPKPFPYAMGNNQLSNLWNRDAKDLDSLPAFRPEQAFDEIVHEWKAIKTKMERAAERRKGIEDATSAKSADVAVQLGEIDREIEDLDVRAHALHWRAIRLVSTTNLKLLGTISHPGDLEGLLKKIEDEAADVVEPPLKRARDDEDEEMGEGTPKKPRVKSEE